MADHEHENRSHTLSQRASGFNRKQKRKSKIAQKEGGSVVDVLKKRLSAILQLSKDKEGGTLKSILKAPLKSRTGRAIQAGAAGFLLGERVGKSLSSVFSASSPSKK